MKELGIFILFVCIHLASCHMCLMSPRQRGDMDISKFRSTKCTNSSLDDNMLLTCAQEQTVFLLTATLHQLILNRHLMYIQSGSPTCTRHELPCGGQPIETPRLMYAPGQTVFFQWQQNFNHYEAGYPGYMDIGIAPNENSTEFTTLTVVTDKYVHSQDYQENYTAIIVSDLCFLYFSDFSALFIKLPEMECNHCVIRARYNAHKPGETTFLQCADIQISKTAKKTKNMKISGSRSDQRKLLPLKRALKLKRFYDSKYKIEKESSGATLYGFAYNPFEPHRSHYVSVDTVSGKLDMLQSYGFGIDDPSGGSDAIFIADEVIAINNWRNMSTVLMHPFGTRETAASVHYTIDFTNGSLIEYGGISDFDGHAINGLSWNTDGTSVAFRILPPDENGILFTCLIQHVFKVGFIFKIGRFVLRSLILDMRTIVFYCNCQTLGSWKMDYIGFTELDVSSYTFMSMHSYIGSGRIFQRFYGGSVVQGNQNPDGFLYHVLRVMDSEADFVVAVNPKTCEVRFSDVTNLRHLHSLQRPVPAA
ncbi:hypothetical protein MAR_018111 [Mya arenaria]|uniref:Uncharacterized protein n=1 Tax=Mya arenaria TaxID=6604 RepID=A0ABY7EHM0_MYAAR|nr:hypothetical protein MAR_018111 [Mya arenaria]